MPPDRVLALAIAVALGAARLAPVVWMVAPLGGPRLPAPARVGLALLLAALAAPLLAASAGADVSSLAPARLALLLARELAIGLCLALVASASFRAAEVAGRLVDVLRGANVAEVLAPTTGERSSPLGALYLLLATLVFIQIGGVPRLIEALLVSYRAVPIAGGLTPGALGAAAVQVTAASARLIASGVGLAAPAIVALWLTDLALGLIARAAPEVPVYFVGLPLKGLLAIGSVLVGLGALAGALSVGFTGWLRLLGRTIAGFTAR